MKKQKLEALILNYKIELRKDLITHFVTDDNFIKDFVKIGRMLDKYDKTFNISTKRYGEIKTNESE
jgi:hypothetical protein